jgi:hypothetical protein
MDPSILSQVGLTYDSLHAVLKYRAINRYIWGLAASDSETLFLDLDPDVDLVNSSGIFGADWQVDGKVGPYCNHGISEGNQASRLNEMW